jgi:tetratricopeptide (TPR) repeat protein
MPTNALAFNYLGLAYHQTGRLPEAEKAYQRALGLNHDLPEVHFSLGCLYLEQNRIDAAKSELTTFTLRRSNSLEGWLRLGTAHLRAVGSGPAYARSAELSAAERSFGEALRLNPADPEALNGIGLARLQRNRVSEALQSFTKALEAQPNFAPALLNLAVVHHQQLNDKGAALRHYQHYLSLKPAPNNAPAVEALVAQIQRELAPPTPARPTPLVQSPPTNMLAAAPQPTPILKTNQPEPPKVQSVARTAPTNPPRTAAQPKAEPPSETPKKVASAPARTTPNPPPATNTPPQVVRVAEEPAIREAQDDPSKPTVAPPTASPLVTTAAVSGLPKQPKQPKRSILQKINPAKLFSGGSKAPASPTAGSPTTDGAAATRDPNPQITGTADTPLPRGLPRYAYKAPKKPSPGNRTEAERWFAQGVQEQQSQRVADSIRTYRRATQLDPAYYEAYYNLGLAASENRDFTQALTAYEYALSLRPQSRDARYFFATTLKQAGYPLDAMAEFEKLVASFPNDVRTHLALGNLYAQQLNQPNKARMHYLKVLEIDPNHPQAPTIGYWLSYHPR